MTNEPGEPPRIVKRTSARVHRLARPLLADIDRLRRTSDAEALKRLRARVEQLERDASRPGRPKGARAPRTRSIHPEVNLLLPWFVAFLKDHPQGRVHSSRAYDHLSAWIVTQEMLGPAYDIVKRSQKMRDSLRRIAKNLTAR